MTKEEVLKDTLKRVLIMWQLFKYATIDLRDSETIKDWAAEAKKNKNNSFVDLRIAAADQLRYLTSFMIKLKSSMKPETFNAIMKTLTSEQVQEIFLLMDEVTELREDALERITTQIKEAKIRAGIPLNNPQE